MYSVRNRMCYHPIFCTEQCFLNSEKLCFSRETINITNSDNKYATSTS